MRKKQFTLIELLMVVALIAVLAGMLLGAVMRAPKVAEAAKCQAQITTLMNAIRQFESEYGYWPVPDAVDAEKELTSDQYKDMIVILQANTSGGVWKDAHAKINKRQIRFLDLSSGDGEYKDVWGNDFHVIVDTGYDGIVKPEADIDANNKKDGEYNYPVLIWSKGKKADDLEDNVYSFKD